MLTMSNTAMTKQNLDQLSSLLGEYYKDKAKACNYDCYNCNLGVLESYTSGHCCAVEVVEREVLAELYSEGGC